MAPRVPSRLYKYCPPERIDILASHSVRFTPADEFNDPFEFISRVENIATVDALKADFSYRTFKEKADEDVRKLVAERLPPEFLASRTRKERQRAKTVLRKQLGRRMPALIGKASAAVDDMAPDVLASFPEFLAEASRRHRSEIGLLCLTEKFDNYAMWAHYANRHEGIVLEFDMDKLRYSAGFKPQGILWDPIKVKYMPTKVFDARADLETSDVLLSKHEDWAYEQEWRIVGDLKAVRSQPEYRGLELVQLAPGSISAVYLGSEFLTKHRLSADQILSTVTNGIEIYLMERKWAEARLRAVKLRDAGHQEPTPLERLAIRMEALKAHASQVS